MKIKLYFICTNFLYKNFIYINLYVKFETNLLASVLVQPREKNLQNYI